MDARALARLTRAARMRRPANVTRAAALLLLALSACTRTTDPTVPEPPSATFELTSESITNGLAIPVRHTCDAPGNISPQLSWTGVPAEAAELVLLVKDIDAPGGTFFHWVVAGIDPADGGVTEGQVPGDELPNDLGTASYGGPCPPSGSHRYFFTLYAVREPIDTTGLDAASLEEAALDGAIAIAEISGTYERA